CPERGAPTPRDNAVPGNAQSWSSALRSSDIFRRAGALGSKTRLTRIDRAVSFVEVDDSVEFRALKVLAPDETCLPARRPQLARHGLADLRAVDCQRFRQHPAIHWPGRFDA